MTRTEHVIAGWDIGGVNIKTAQVVWKAGKISAFNAAVRPFEIWREPERLIRILHDIAEELGISDQQPMAVTMTAELSDVFRTKREGVRYVLDTVERAFEKARIYPFTIDGRFVGLEQARQNPLPCAATNWLASALFIATDYPDCILVDIGSTTTDFVLIRKGKALPKGRTDTHRLVSGELVYTGALRTNPNTIANHIPVQGKMCRVAAEYFSSMADVYLILGRLSADDYTCPTADGRAKTVTAAGERLARLVCSDGEIMDEHQIRTLAGYLQEKQIQQIVEALFQVLSGLEADPNLPLVVVGTGGFLAKEAARRLDKPVIDLEKQWGNRMLAAYPALGAAHLLSRELDRLSHD